MDKKPKFIFILDRSWSMEDFGRMEIALEALKLFLISLPAECHFQIISFGSSHQWQDHKRELIEYNDQNLQRIKQEIAGSRNNFLGGTEIYAPLKELYEHKTKPEYQNQHWNVFLLTDGAVSDRERVIDLIR